MNYSVQRAVSDGSLVLLPISIEYFDRSEITVIFDDGAGTYDWEWVGTSDHAIAFPTAIPEDVEVMVRRETDMSELRHSFSGGAAFTEQSIDEAFEQVLHIAQEAKEGAVLGEIFQDVDMHGYKMVNVGDGVDPTDGASVGQLLDAVQDITDQVATAVSAANTASAAAATSTSNAASTTAAKDAAVAAAASAEADATATAADAVATAAALADAETASAAAEAAATAAAGSADSAEDAAALAADFVEHYLGPKEAPPTVDNSGDPLQVGQLYWDIYGNVMQVWSGTAWVAAYVTSGDYVTLAGVQTLLNKTLVGPVVTANSASPALTITQEGTGDCVLINDDTSGDASPVVVTAAGNVCIGGPATGQKLAVVGGNIALDQTTGVKFAFNAGDSFTASGGTNTARYGLTYNAMGATFNVGLSGWGGLGFYTADVLRMNIDSLGRVIIGTGTAGNQRMRVYNAVTDPTAAQTNLLADGVMTITADNAYSHGSQFTSYVNHGAFNASASMGSGGVCNLKSYVYATGTAGVVTALPGFYADVRNVGTGTVAGMAGLSCKFVNSGGGTVSNVYGVYMQDVSISTNTYALYSAVASGTNKYGVYCVGTADNLFNGKTTVNAEFKPKSITETVHTITDGAAVDLNPLNGGIQQWTLGASRTPTATAFVGGQSMTLMVNAGAAYTLTWPSVTWVGGSAPTLATSGWTIVELFKVGGVLYGAAVGNVA